MDKVDTSKERALQIQDKLHKYKAEYFVPHGHLYFSAHQLGPMSKRVKYAMIKVMDEWQTYANGGWRYGLWMSYEDKIAEKLAQVLRADP